MASDLERLAWVLNDLGKLRQRRTPVCEAKVVLVVSGSLWHAEHTHLCTVVPTTKAPMF